eukprot:365629-Chlamydomonas_euryale.AAC.7
MPPRIRGGIPHDSPSVLCEPRAQRCLACQSTTLNSLTSVANTTSCRKAKLLQVIKVCLPPGMLRKDGTCALAGRMVPAFTWSKWVFCQGGASVTLARRLSACFWAALP